MYITLGERKLLLPYVLMCENGDDNLWNLYVTIIMVGIHKEPPPPPALELFASAISCV